jgi:hypothetical protein
MSLLLGVLKEGASISILARSATQGHGLSDVQVMDLSVDATAPRTLIPPQNVLNYRLEIWPERRF